MLLGRYCSFSVALFLLVFGNIFLRGLIQIRIAKQYEAVWQIQKKGLLFTVLILCSMILMNIQQEDFEKKVENLQKAQNFEGIIMSNGVKSKYQTEYQCKIIDQEEQTIRLMYCFATNQTRYLF